MTLRTLPAIRAEARRRGMVVKQQRRHGCGPVYHVRPAYSGGVDLQQQAGDTTPPVVWLDGLPELLRWALRTWPEAGSC